MSTIVQPSSIASASDTPSSPAAQFSFQHVMDALLSGKGLRLALIVGAVFLAWKAFQGLRSLFWFWIVFGIAWVVV